MKLLLVYFCSQLIAQKSSVILAIKLFCWCISIHFAASLKSGVIMMITIMMMMIFEKIECHHARGITESSLWHLTC